MNKKETSEYKKSCKAWLKQEEAIIEENYITVDYIKKLIKVQNKRSDALTEETNLVKSKIKEARKEWKDKGYFEL